MGKAIGMIETLGLAISIELADAMLKAAEIQVINLETVDRALVTISVQGDVSSVQVAIKIGSDIAIKANAYISSIVIPHPDIDTERLAREKAKKADTIAAR